MPEEMIAPGGPLPPEVADADPLVRERYQRARQLAYLLDSRFKVPIIKRTFGVDAILALVPGIGGLAGLAMAAIVIGQGVAIGARGATVVRMLLNVGVDALIASIPLLGVPLTALFKANERNVRLLSTHALDPDRTRAESRRVVLWSVVGMLVTVVAVVIATVALLIWLVSLLF